MATFPQLLISITVTVAAFSYLFGILLLSLPFGSKALKQIGEGMVTDGATALVFTAALFGIVIIWNTILNIGSSNPQPFAYAMVYQSAGRMITQERTGAEAFGTWLQLLQLMVGTASRLPALGLGFSIDIATKLIELWVAPSAFMVNAYVTTLSLLLVWVNFIGPPGNFWALFIIIGSFFYAMPGRVGRTVAGWLIGTAFGYLFCIPFWYQFITFVSGPMSNLDLAFIQSSQVQNAINPVNVAAGKYFTVISNVQAPLYDGTSLILAHLLLTGVFMLMMASITVGLARVLTGAIPGRTEGQA